MELKDLFDGYIRIGEDKSAKEKYKTALPNRTFEEAQKLTSFSGVIKKDYILVDFDSEEDANIAFNIITDKKLNCIVLQTTRGKHFYFKNIGIERGKTNTKLACGLTADIKIGGNLGTLKLNNNMREVIYKTNSVDNLPKYFYPVETKKDFKFLREGDGRNENLFGYIIVLQQNSLSKEEIRETCNIINNYVFKEKLPENELETILRDDAFKKETFIENKTFNYEKFAKYLIQEEHICRINNQLYIFNGEVYITGKSFIEASMLKYIPNFVARKRTEAYKMVELLLPIGHNERYADERYIAFKNGIYDIKTNKLLDFDSNLRITNQIPWNYNPNANNQKIKNILNNWVDNDNDMLMLLEECIGMCMYRSNKISTCFILTGKKDNGKSTFIKMLNALLGENNCSSISLHNLESRFNPASITGKLANLGDDIGDAYINSTENFKKLVTGETIQLEQKGQDHYEYKSYAKLIFCANEIPRIKDPTGAVIDKRIIYLPFNSTFTGKTKDPNLYKEFEKNEEMMETLILIGIEGIKRVIENKGFTKSALAEQTKQEYKFKNSPILQFIDEYGEENFYYRLTEPIYEEYREFCRLNGFCAESHATFRKKICSNLNITTTKRSARVKMAGKKFTKIYEFSGPPAGENIEKKRKIEK